MSEIASSPSSIKEIVLHNGKINIGNTLVRGQVAQFINAFYLISIFPTGKNTKLQFNIVWFDFRVIFAAG